MPCNFEASFGGLSHCAAADMLFGVRLICFLCWMDGTACPCRDVAPCPLEMQLAFAALRRLRKPISDEEALAIGKTFDVPGLFEHVARARRRVVGSMFPTDIQ